MMPTNVPRMGVLSCLIRRDEETNLFLAHCLNFDLVECGPDPDTAWANLKISLKQFIEYSYTSYPQSLTLSADLDEWKQFVAALRVSTKPERVDTIDIDLKPPLPELSAPVWMQGVTGDGRDCSKIQ